MTDSEQEELRKEVKRQAHIIDLLLASNTQLKEALAWCRYLLTHPQQPVYAHDKAPDSIVQPNDYAREPKEGVNFSKDAILAPINGVIREFDDIRKYIIGVNQLSDDIGQNKIGVNKSLDDITPLIIGVNISNDEDEPLMVGVNSAHSTNTTHDGSAVSAGKASGRDDKQTPVEGDVARKPAAAVSYAPKIFRYGNKEVALFSINAHDMLEGKLPVNYHKLFALLRKLIIRASYSGLINTTQILMKLHESPAQSLKSLQQLTHLSEDGITKRINSMKKFGLIVRAPRRQLLLTPKALHMMDEAR